MIHHNVLALVAMLAAPASASAQDIRKGAITVSRPWSRATAPRATIGAGFLAIRSSAAQPDRLVGATSPRAERVEIHTMSLENGVMRMRPLANGVAVPPRGQTILAPGGIHLMLIGLKAPLKRGERIPATLRFARAGAVTIHFTVAGAGAAAPVGAHGRNH
jgi:copper(I)-binding protein